MSGQPEVCRICHGETGDEARARFQESARNRARAVLAAAVKEGQ